MHLILSILAGFAGSALGAAARAGIDAAERQLRGEPQPDNVIVNASPVAAVAGGALGLILGARRAFWIAALTGLIRFTRNRTTAMTSRT